MIKKNLLIIFLGTALQLMACSSIQQPLKYGQGYAVIPTERDQYRIEFFSKNRGEIEAYWEMTADQLCPMGFRVLYVKQELLNFDLYVPIAGGRTNVGRMEFIQNGEIICNGHPSKDIVISESSWREFNKETQALKPVSSSWLERTLKLRVSRLSHLPSKRAVEKITSYWGDPVGQHSIGSENISYWWRGGDSWAPNQVVLIEQDDYLKMVIIIPGVVAHLLGSYATEDGTALSEMVISGSIPAYYYRPDFCSKS
jgi:hypothetical protein